MNFNPLSNAIFILNKKNSSDLWLKSCYLSCISFFDNTYGVGINVLFPALHNVKINNFCKLILKANSREYKTELLSGNDFISISNYILDINNNDEKPVIENGNFNFKDFVFRTANSQIRFQNSEIERTLGRNYALFVHYSKEKEKELKENLKEGYIDIETTLLSKNGIKPELVLYIGYLLAGFYKMQFDKYNLVQDSVKGNILKIKEEKAKINYCFEIIKDVIDNIKPLYDNFSFGTDLKGSTHPFFNENIFIAFWRIASKSTAELQQLISKEKAFRIGNLSEQISALERFPIVKLNNSRYVIPDIPLYMVAFPNLLHFTLQEYFPPPSNQYNNQMGYLQEFYLEDLFKHSIGKLPLIPETKYKISTDEVKGPDFILQDINNRLILIESKSKRFSAQTRVYIDDSDLENDMNRIFKALKKLPEKYEHLYRNLPEYSSYHEIIGSSNKIKPLYVVLVSGGLEFMPQIVATFIENTPNHFLNKDFPHAFCIIDIRDFEYAVEIASQTDNLLSEILEKYWTSAKSYFSSPANFNLYDIQIDNEKSFAIKYFREMQKNFEEINKGCAHGE